MTPLFKQLRLLLLLKFLKTFHLLGLKEFVYTAKMFFNLLVAKFIKDVL